MLWWGIFCSLAKKEKNTLKLDRSFNPCLMHGTMLPSSTPLDDLESQFGSNNGGVAASNKANQAPNARTNVSGKDGGTPRVRVRVSRGSHPSVRNKDRDRAERYKSARAQRVARSQHWGWNLQRWWAILTTMLLPKLGGRVAV
jgi:hypothetical protein